MMKGCGCFFNNLEEIIVSCFVDNYSFGPTKKILADKTIQILDCSKKGQKIIYKGPEITALAVESLHLTDTSLYKSRKYSGFIKNDDFLVENDKFTMWG